jgi:hypothetical protein
MSVIAVATVSSDETLRRRRNVSDLLGAINFIAVSGRLTDVAGPTVRAVSWS